MMSWMATTMWTLESSVCSTSTSSATHCDAKGQGVCHEVRSQSGIQDACGCCLATPSYSSPSMTSGDRWCSGFPESSPSPSSASGGFAPARGFGGKRSSSSSSASRG